MDLIEKHRKLWRVAKKAAGPRYSKEVAINLEVGGIFHGLCHEKVYKDHSLKLLGDMSRKFFNLADDFHEEVKSGLIQLHDSCQTTLRNFIDDPKKIEGRLLKKTLTDLKTIDGSIESFLQNLYSSNEGNDTLKSQSRKLLEVLESVYVQFTSDKSLLFRNGCLWLYGDAGSGKTHLFCDVAERRLHLDKPTIIIMGQRLTCSNLWDSLCYACDIEPKTSPKKDFLNFIDLHAQEFDSKLLLLVDAINENKGVGLWNRSLKPFVKEIKKRPHVTLALSCRTSYQAAIAKQEYIEKEFCSVEHQGFSKELPEAVEAFFSFHNIKYHEIPLVREFENPLFLKIYCRTHKGQDTPYRGHSGLKDILEKYFHHIDSKVLADRLGYTSAKKPAWQIGKLIAEWMAINQRESIPRSQANLFCDLICGDMGIEADILPEMVEEGLLIEEIDEASDSANDPVISFSYQRFSDILIGRYLLSEKAGFDRSNPKKSFQTDGNLEYLLVSPWLNSGILEAIASILPEWTNGQTEILDVIPKGDRPTYFDYWLDSLVWRSSKSFPNRKKLVAILNEISSGSEESYHRTLDTLLAVGTTPEHPLNADFLHKILKNRDLEKRDVSWSIYLHDNYEENGVIVRLVEWSWLSFGRVKANDESARLAGIILSWFFTSQNRFLRDRATKSFVCLLSRRLVIVDEILKMFSEINDPYVLERVVLSAYGSAVRSNDLNGIKLLAQSSYSLFFKAGNPPTNIVTRFYARALIKFAQYHGAMRHIPNKNISPPFSCTKFPQRMPSLETLEKKYRLEARDRYDKARSQNAIVSSISSSGDFGRYVLGTDGKVTGWFDPFYKHREIYNNWKNSLSPKRRKAIESYKIALELSKSSDQNLRRIARTNISQGEIKKMTEVLRRELGLHGVKNKEKRESVDSVLMDKHSRAGRLPAEFLQRYVLKRVFELGWNVKSFGQFDGYVNYNYSRSATKSERFGKKYQWIAYFEILAILSDFCDFEKRRKKEALDIDDFSSTEQIDPTIVLRKPIDRPVPQENFKFYSFNNWNSGVDHTTWLHDRSDYPEIVSLVSLKDQNQKEWMLLEGMYNFDQPNPPDIEKHSTETRSIWFVINSYLFKLNDLERVKTFLEEANFLGRWMPYCSGMINPHFGEIGWSERYFANQGPEWVTHSDVPFTFAETTESYLYESGTFDCSMDESFTIHLPKQPLRKLAGLKNHWIDGNFVDREGNLVARDLFEEKSPGGLIFDRSKLSSILKENNLGMFWSILSERDIHSPISDRNWRGRLEYSTGLVYSGESFEEIGSKFKFLNPPT